MNTNQLRYFVTAAECRSFTKAADQFYITQTAITQQIRALEDSLGVPLFDRSSRPISLTPAGSAFLSDARSILGRIDQAVNRIQEVSTGMVGTLRIGYTKGFERSNFSNSLRFFHNKYPNILVSCYRRNTDLLAAGLLKDESIEYRLIERSPLMVAVYSNHPLSRRESLRRSELHGERLLFMTPSSTGDSVSDLRFYEMYEQAGYHPDIFFRSNDVESILMMVSIEEGISIIPSYVTHKLTNAENLVFIPLIGEEEVVEIIAAWKRSSGNLALQQFLGHYPLLKSE